MMQMAFTTFCCNVLLTAQCTYINLLPNIMLCVIVNGCFGALPNMRENMFPWSIQRVTDLPPDAKLGKGQQNMHRLMQLVGTPRQLFQIKPQCHE